MQEPACGYQVGVEMVSDMPEFLIYDTEREDFTIFSDNISHQSKASYFVKGSVEVPTDMSNTQTVTVSTDVKFELEMVADCDMTAFVDWHLKTAEPSQASVLGDSTRIELGSVQDTVSR